jgi:lysyl-tRNA synthetase class 2
LEFEPLDQYRQRIKKRAEIAEKGIDPYPRKYQISHSIEAILTEFGSRTGPELEAAPIQVQVAGRLVALRPHGKAGFAHLLGQGQRLQFYVKLDEVGPETFDLFRSLDIGDIVGVSGKLFRTKTNELTIRTEKITLLAKSLLPLPEKWHGLEDVDTRYRQRYLDLIANPDVRNIFLKRAQIIREIRHFFDSRGYIEVETPMMHPIAGGATARPFITHHNTYHSDLYLRIAPELYLKRLIVGGFDRVYEINRNFRNEGVDALHNPEFTMLEFYEAYSDYRDMMDLSEALLGRLAEVACGSKQVRYGDHLIDFSKFERLSMVEAIAAHWPTAAGPAPSQESLAEPGVPRQFATRYNESAPAMHKPPIRFGTQESDGELIAALFDEIAQDRLIQPTIIYDFPVAVSPLSKARPDKPCFAERFELSIGGSEICNGFSELNDPEDQERRFRAQIERGGDEAPKQLDEDYIRALSQGMPPTGGEGVGIDRLVMLLTNTRSIREVLLFPLLRPRDVRDGVRESSSPDPSQSRIGPK